MKTSAWRCAAILATILPATSYATFSDPKEWQPVHTYIHAESTKDETLPGTLDWYPKTAEMVLTPAPIQMPLPSSAWLLGAGVIGFIGLRRRKTDKLLPGG